MLFLEYWYFNADSYEADYNESSIVIFFEPEKVIAKVYQKNKPEKIDKSFENEVYSPTYILLKY